jgi:hypothetical protein
MSHRIPGSRPRPMLTALLAVVILVPALIGFGTKFREFLALVRFEEGAFTVVPILNYLLVGAGFLLLFLWAILHGMFRDIERPKFTMLANERRLDAQQEEDERRAREEEWYDPDRA